MDVIFVMAYLDNAINAELLQFLSISKSTSSLRFNSLLYACVIAGPVTNTFSLGSVSLHECDRFRLLLVVGVDSLQILSSSSVSESDDDVDAKVSSLLNEKAHTSITLCFANF